MKDPGHENVYFEFRLRHSVLLGCCGGAGQTVVDPAEEFSKSLPRLMAAMLVLSSRLV